MSARVHPTALVEPGVEIGEGTSIWDNVHLRGPSTIGRGCIIGEKSYVAYGVNIGDLVKVNAFVYICTGVVIERGVMIAAGVVFTNDKYPRAATSDLALLRPSDPDDHTLATTVHEGATIGARAVIGPGIEIGRFAMVGMGAVITTTVPDFTLVAGQPGRAVALVCRCGEPFRRVEANGGFLDAGDLACAACGLRYAVVHSAVVELTPPG